jgi:hypothetical protein
VVGAWWLGQQQQQQQQAVMMMMIQVWFALEQKDSVWQAGVNTQASSRRCCLVPIVK